MSSSRWKHRICSARSTGRSCSRLTDAIFRPGRRCVTYRAGGRRRCAQGTGAVELLVSGAGENGITLADAQQAAQRSNMRYDRDGDSHYDILSALQKSIRGSDPDAAVHYPRASARGWRYDWRRGVCWSSRARTSASLIRSARRLSRRVRRQRLSARSARGTHSARTGGDRHGDRAQVQQQPAYKIDAALADICAGKSGDIRRISSDAHYGGAAKLDAD